MADLLLKDIDEETLARMRAAASERACSLEDIGVRALRFAFGLGIEDFAPRDRQDIATLRGVWNQGENQAFREAIEAFKRVDSGPSFEARNDRRKT